MNRIARTASAALLLLTFGATAAFAHSGHEHGQNDHMEYADPVLFDNDIVTDCSLIGEDMILWQLTGSDAVTYAELHIGEPEPSVTSRSSAPYIWVSPRYNFALIDADVDRIVGDIDADARLVATICDPADATDDATEPSEETDTTDTTDATDTTGTTETTDASEAAASNDTSNTPWLLAVTGLIGAALGLIAGRLVGGSRTTS